MPGRSPSAPTSASAGISCPTKALFPLVQTIFSASMRNTIRRRIVGEEGRGVVVVHELMQAVEDLVGEVARAQLGDDLAADAVEHLGQAQPPRGGASSRARTPHSRSRVRRADWPNSRSRRATPTTATCRPWTVTRASTTVRAVGGRSSRRKATPAGEIAQRVIPAHDAHLGVSAQDPDALRPQPQQDGVGEMAVELARRPDPLEIALQDLGEQLVRGFAEIDHESGTINEAEEDSMKR